MDATTQLALMAKAKRVFETDGTFLSFPVLSPFAYPPEKLTFAGPATDIPALAEFSLLVNRLPRGALFQPTEDAYLWDVYADLFRDATVAGETADPERLAAYERAAALLYVTGADGLRQESATYQAYRQHRDAWIAATEEYKAAQVTAEASADPEVKTRWQAVEEPALRAKLAQAEADWAAAGFRAEVEAAERAIRAFTERPSAGRLWEEWRDAFNPDIDTMTDPLTNQPFAPTAFSPADPFDEQWPRFTLSAGEVASLVAQAPPELKEVLDLGGGGAGVESVSFQVRSVGLTRPWLRPEIFRARFWRLPESEPALSDGGNPARGRWPAYVTGVVFARNVVETRKPPAGGGPSRVPVRTLPALKVRPELLRAPVPASPARPVVRDHRSPAASPTRPSVRDHRAAVGRAATPPAAARAVLAGAAARTPARAAPSPARSVSPLARLRGSVFPRIPVRPAPVTPRPIPVVPPTPPPPEVSRDVSILAFICKRLPKCPDPDPTLTWTG